MDRPVVRSKRLAALAVISLALLAAATRPAKATIAAIAPTPSGWTILPLANQGNALNITSLTVRMRKLIVVLNVIVKHRTLWDIPAWCSK